MPLASPKTFYRIETSSQIIDSITAHGKISLPLDLAAKIRPGDGLIVAEWDECSQTGTVNICCVITDVNISEPSAKTKWVEAGVTLRPNPAGRRWWKNPYFRFAPEVVKRYMLEDIFAEHFPDYTDIEFGSVSGGIPGNYTPMMKMPGYVYVIRSEYGYKIGKTVNIKSRTRLFEVKLPFPIDLVHYAHFEDYSLAERDFHKKFAAKRLEGEWFDLDNEDINYIKGAGKVLCD